MIGTREETRIGRSPASWLISALLWSRGLKLRGPLAAIESLNAATEESVRAYQFEKLRSLVEMAYKGSVAYRTIWQRGGFAPEKFRSLDDVARVPTVDRVALQEFSREEWRTSNRAGAVSRRTSGSTGEPLDVELDKEGYAAQLAVRAGFMMGLGLRFGSREARFWGRPHGLADRVLDRILERRRFSFAGSNDPRDVLHDLLRFRPEYIYGYTSLLVELAALWSASEYSLPGLRAVVSTAEVLHPFQRRIIKQAFNCPVINEYGCSELDIVASECRHETLHVAQTNVYVESVQFEGVDEIVLTGLESRFMPLIRYRVRDRGRVSWLRCECGRGSQIITNLEGRTSKQMVILPNGQRRHCVVFSEILNSLPADFGVRKFRVVQEGIDRFHWYIDCPIATDAAKLLLLLRQKTHSELKYLPGVDLTVGPIPPNEFGKFTDFVALDVGD